VRLRLARSHTHSRRHAPQIPSSTILAHSGHAPHRRHSLGCGFANCR
jgi:hypothetical protein